MQDSSDEQSPDELLDYIKVEHSSSFLQSLFNSKLYFTDRAFISKTLTLYNSELPSLKTLHSKVRLKRSSSVTNYLNDRYLILDSTALYFFKSKHSYTICDYFPLAYITLIYLCNDLLEITLKMESEIIDGFVTVKLNHEGRRDELLVSLKSRFKKSLNKNLLIVDLTEYEYDQIKRSNYALKKKLSKLNDKNSTLNRLSTFLKGLVPSMPEKMKRTKSHDTLSLEESTNQISLKNLTLTKSEKEEIQKQNDSKGHFYSDAKKLSGLVVEGFVLKQKGNYSSYDLKYFVALMNDITYYNIVCVAFLNLSQFPNIEVKKVSSYNLEIFLENFYSIIKNDKKLKNEEIDVKSFVTKSFMERLGPKPNSSLNSSNSKDNDSKEKCCISITFDKKSDTDNWYTLLKNICTPSLPRRSSFKVTKDDFNDSTSLEAIKSQTEHKFKSEIWCKTALRWENIDFQSDITAKTYIILINKKIAFFRCKSVKNILRKPTEDFKGDILLPLLKNENEIKPKNIPKNISNLIFDEFKFGAVLTTESRPINLVFNNIKQRAFWSYCLTKCWRKESLGFTVNKSYLKAYEELAPDDKDLIFVFTDVENKTSLWKDLEKEKVKGLFEEHDKILRNNARQFKGYEVKNEGESFFFVFRRLDEAIKWGLKNVKDLEVLGNVFIKTGIKFGAVEKRERTNTGRIDYFGNSVNFSARLKDLAKGGEVLVTKDEWEMVKGDEKYWEGKDVEEVNDVKIKGLSELVTLYKLKWKGEEGKDGKEEKREGE